MPWDNIDKVLEQSAGGDYLRLNAGTPVKVVFIGEPITYYKRFGERTEYPQPVEGASFKFKCNVAVLGTKGTFEIKIFEQGKKTLKAVIAAVKKYGLDKVYEIVREGKGQQDTVYSVFYERDLTKTDKDAIAKLKPFELFVRDTATTTEKSNDVPF